MVAALDTNAVIDVCNDTVRIGAVVGHFSKHENDQLIITAQVMSELTLPSNFAKLAAVCRFDEQRYFTIGHSVIGGPDIIRGDNASRDRIQRFVLDAAKGYESYLKEKQLSGEAPVSAQVWNRRNNRQSDAVAYERACELGCDTFVTTDRKLKNRVPLTNECKIVSLSDFVSELSASSMSRS